MTENTEARASYTDIAADSLTNFVSQFNQMIEESDRQDAEITSLKWQIDDQAKKHTSNEALLQNQIDGYKRQNEEILKTIEQQISLISSMGADLQQAEKNAHKHMGTVRELEMSRNKANELQKQLTLLKSQGNAKQLKEQVGRIKDKSKEKDKKITRLEQEKKALDKKVSDGLMRERQSIEKIKTLQSENKNIDFTGIYHKGDHHLVMWPQVNKVVGHDGETYECRSLLYMHQSGTGKLITFDKNNMASVLCKSPAGGLRLPADVRSFADDWLFNVNVTQNGNVSPQDMKMTDLNK